MHILAAATVLMLLAAPAVVAQSFMCEDQFTGREQLTTTLTARPLNPFDPLKDRLLRYSEIAERHRMRGLASYYSAFFDGRKTANGEIFRNRRYSAAHLTLPLGTWVEVTSAPRAGSSGCVSTIGAPTRRSSSSISHAQPRSISVSTSRQIVTWRFASSRCQVKSRLKKAKRFRES